MAVYILGMAMIEAANSSHRWRDLLLPNAVDCLVTAWLFWIGSAIGSFLNVVAWRMPRGRGINGLSHCPWCNQRLAARDNWPVFGWIALRGRCRTCRLPISPRYPIVEACVGLSITVVGLLELYGGLINVPFLGLQGEYQGPFAMPIVTPAIAGVWVYHTLAVAGAWALGLIRFDNQRLPISLILWVLLVAILPQLIWWPLGVVPWQATLPDPWPVWGFLDAVMRVLVSLVAAVLIGRLLGRHLCPTADPKLNPTGAGTLGLLDLIVMLCLPAVVVGWQAFFNVVLLAVGLAVVLRAKIPGQRDSLAWLSIALPVALTCQLASWSWVEASYYLPSSQSPPWVILLAAGLLVLLANWLKSPVAKPDTALPAAFPSGEQD